MAHHWPLSSGESLENGVDGSPAVPHLNSGSPHPLRSARVQPEPSTVVGLKLSGGWPVPLTRGLSLEEGLRKEAFQPKSLQTHQIRCPFVSVPPVFQPLGSLRKLLRIVVMEPVADSGESLIVIHSQGLPWCAQESGTIVSSSSLSIASKRVMYRQLFPTRWGPSLSKRGSGS